MELKLYDGEYNIDRVNLDKFDLSTKSGYKSFLDEVRYIVELHADTEPDTGGECYEL